MGSPNPSTDKKAMIEAVAKSNNATLIEGFVSLLTPISYKCNFCGTEGTGAFKKLITTVWCKDCKGKGGDELETILTTGGFEFTKNYTISGTNFTYDYAITTEEDAIVVILLKPGEKAPIDDERTQKAKDIGFKSLQIESSILSDKVKLKEILENTLESLDTTDDQSSSEEEEVIVKKTSNDSNISDNVLGMRSNIDITGAEFFTNKSFVVPSKNPVPTGVHVANLYIRVSHKSQTESGISVEEQVVRAKKYCAEKGFYVKATYFDLGVSAKDADAQPALKELRKRICPREKVIACHRDRVSRNLTHINILEDELKKKKCELITVDLGEIDPNTPEGLSMRGMQDIIAGVERMNTGTRVRNKMAYLSVNGALNTRPKYGYQKGIKGELHVPCEREQKMIEYIRLYLKQNPDTTVSAMVTHLNKLPDPCLRNARAWYHTTLKKVLIDNNIPYPHYDEHRHDEVLREREARKKLQKQKV
jgi:DNA invertase Pin-like site-specific DNA recombinase